MARNVFDEPLYEAENDVRTLRNAAKRWAVDSKMDVPNRSASTYRKSANSPAYEGIYEALLVGDADTAKMRASKFVSAQKDSKKAQQSVSASVKSRQPFRVGPYTSAEHRSDFMAWAKNRLPKKDYEQAQRVQARYEKAAKTAGLW